MGKYWKKNFLFIFCIVKEGAKVKFALYDRIDLTVKFDFGVEK